MSRAYTPEEVQKQLLTHFHTLSDYWSRLPGKTPQERCDGLVFSILVALDGDAFALPAFDLIPSPHPDDKQYHIDNGDDWYEPVVINDIPLHEMWYKRATEDTTEFKGILHDQRQTHQD